MATIKHCGEPVDSVVKANNILTDIGDTHG